MIRRAPWLTIAVFAATLALIAWQPFGAGNSVAVCGLAGALATWQALRDDIPLAARLVFPAVCFAGALVLIANSDIHGPPLLVVAVIGWLAKRSRSKGSGHLA